MAFLQEAQHQVQTHQLHPLPYLNPDLENSEG